MIGESVVLIRYGELHLKGRNRPYFEQLLRKSIKSAVREYGAKLERAQGRYYLSGFPPGSEQAVVTRLTRVFGIHSVSLALRCEKNWDDICQAAFAVMAKALESRSDGASFKVQARRADKFFPMDSMEINREMGAYLLSHFPALRVDVHAPEIELGVEVREHCYVYAGETLCAGGLPAGCNGKVALLLSGGIDSPVAGHMMMKRGLGLECVYFHSPPYTSERAKEKVVSLARTLARYSGSIHLHVVPFTEMQMEIYQHCPPDHGTIMLRRAMMQISQQIAQKYDCGALATGEAVGQVASQTLESLASTEDGIAMPVLRPLIGFDKDEIIVRARQIDTYETSILPYEDCCTIFTPRNPVIHPKVAEMRRSQSRVDNWDALMQSALEATERSMVAPLAE